MSELEKIKRLLRKAKFLQRDGDVVEALKDLITEREHLGKDHHRIECVEHLLNDHGTVTLVKGNMPRIRNRYSVIVGGKHIRGRYLGDALDRTHKVHHSKGKWRVAR